MFATVYGLYENSFQCCHEPQLVKTAPCIEPGRKKEQDQSYFERLGENSKRQRLDQTAQFHQKKIGVVKASYEVSLLVALNMKPYTTIAESFVLPAAKTLVKNLIWGEATGKLADMSLSNDTVKRRIQEKSGDIADQVVAEVKDPKFGVQLDESTDVANCSFMSALYKITR